MNAPGPRCALVVTFDRFPASILGCYGNEWIETPHVDRFAALGLVADQCWTARVGPTTADNVFAASPGLEALKSLSIRTLLFQEADSQIDFSGVYFDVREVIRGDLGPTAKPDRVPLAHLARKAVAALTAEQAKGRSSLVWIHAVGLTIPAFPPEGFADLYQDEFEDREIHFETMSEDERLHHPSTTAGMASLLDHWMGQALAVLDQNPASLPMLAVFTAAQGTAWHPLPRTFGSLDDLRGQSVQVPWLMRIVPDDRAEISAGLRNDRLCSTRNLGPLFAGWFGAAASSGAVCDRVETAIDSGALRITTDTWAVIYPPPASPGVSTPQNSSETISQPSEIQTADEPGRPLLFRKPEDYWEVNNLAEVHADVVEELSQSSPGAARQ